MLRGQIEEREWIAEAIAFKVLHKALMEEQPKPFLANEAAISSASADIQAAHQDSDELSDSDLEGLAGGKTNVKRPGTGDN